MDEVGRRSEIVCRVNVLSFKHLIKTIVAVNANRSKHTVTEGSWSSSCTREGRDVPHSRNGFTLSM